MTNQQRQVRDWMIRGGQECPDKPTVPSLEVRKLRAKLILEEALETIAALGFSVVVDEPVKIYPHCGSDSVTLVDIADGCEDLKVVTEGTLIACGLLHNTILTETDPLFNEVMRSNNSKIPADGKVIKDSDGKILKPDTYFKPNLASIINNL